MYYALVVTMYYVLCRYSMHTIQRPDPWHGSCPEGKQEPFFLWRMKRVLGRRTERRKRHPTSTVCYAPYHTNSMYVLCSNVYSTAAHCKRLDASWSTDTYLEYVPRVHLLNHIYLQGYTYYIVVFYSTSAHVEWRQVNAKGHVGEPHRSCQIIVNGRTASRDTAVSLAY